MVEYVWPVSITPNSSSVNLTDGAGRFVSPFTGTTRTVSRPGSSRLKMSLKFHALKTTKRGALQAFIASMNGAENRVWCRDHSYTKQGSFPATELFTNTEFDGTTGWTGSNTTLSSYDNALRVSPSSVGSSRSVSQAPAATQYAPYVLRSVVVDGDGTTGLNIGRYAQFSSGVASSDYSTTSRGYGAIAGVRLDASAQPQYPVVIAESSGYTIGTYVDVRFASYSRCALVDNAPNLLLSSQTMGTDSSPVVWSGTNASVVPNPSPGAVAPDGTSTADAIVENSATSTHYIGQGKTVSSAGGDYSFSVSLKAGTRTFAAIQVGESISGHVAYAFINLSTGAYGTVATTGANISNVRAFVVSQGNGWYRFSLVFRKVSAATTLTSLILIADSISSYTYTGNGSSRIYAWGASLAQSSVPVKYTATTTAAVAAAAQTGSALNIKGLPASTTGLLLPGDQVQVGDELKIVTASLDSDASGLGYLQFSPPLRVSPSDNDPVIIHQPMGKFLLSENENGWESTPGVFTSAEVSLVEAVD